jgi:hypothetical protein
MRPLSPAIFQRFSHPVYWISITLFSFASCFNIISQPYPPIEVKEMVKPAYIEIKPETLSLIPGQAQFVDVTVRDVHKNPLPNKLVQASINMPELASLEPESALTDKRGKAIFSVRGKGSPPAEAVITFTAGSVMNVVEFSLIQR